MSTHRRGAEDAEAVADNESVRESESKDQEKEEGGEDIPECAVAREVGDGVLIEMSEDWQRGARHLTFS